MNTIKISQIQNMTRFFKCTDNKHHALLMEDKMSITKTFWNFFLQQMYFFFTNVFFKKCIFSLKMFSFKKCIFSLKMFSLKV